MDDTGRPDPAGLSERDIAELKESFDQWFYGLLQETETCLKRDVLRESKPVLWTNWLKFQPTYTTTELEKEECLTPRSHIEWATNKKKKLTKLRSGDE
jgi:hypothetical protein